MLTELCYVVAVHHLGEARSGRERKQPITGKIDEADEYINCHVYVHADYIEYPATNEKRIWRDTTNSSQHMSGVAN